MNQEFLRKLLNMRKESNSLAKQKDLNLKAEPRYYKDKYSDWEN
jgi:hypothetical protein